MCSAHHGTRLTLSLLFIIGLAGGMAYAKEPDSPEIAERVAACTACHGDQGRSGPDAYYPRIAGKPERYLYNQLLNFREGRRRYELMTLLIEHLPDAYLREIARYFSALNPPYPPPALPAAPQARLRQGRALVLHGDRARKIPACVQCHGEPLMGAVPAIPGLLGLPRDYLSAQLGAWKAGTRRSAEPDCMGEIAGRLDAGDIAAIAAWIAAQPVPPHARPATDLARIPIACGAVPQHAEDESR